MRSTFDPKNPCIMCRKKLTCQVRCMVKRDYDRGCGKRKGAGKK